MEGERKNSRRRRRKGNDLLSVIYDFVKKKESIF